MRLEVRLVVGYQVGWRSSLSRRVALHGLLDSLTRELLLIYHKFSFQIAAWCLLMSSDRCSICLLLGLSDATLATDA